MKKIVITLLVMSVNLFAPEGNYATLNFSGHSSATPPRQRQQSQETVYASILKKDEVPAVPPRGQGTHGLQTPPRPPKNLSSSSVQEQEQIYSKVDKTRVLQSPHVGNAPAVPPHAKNVDSTTGESVFGKLGKPPVVLGKTLQRKPAMDTQTAASLQMSAQNASGKTQLGFKKPLPKALD